MCMDTSTGDLTAAWQTSRICCWLKAIPEMFKWVRLGHSPRYVVNDVMKASMVLLSGSVFFPFLAAVRACSCANWRESSTMGL